MTTTARHVCCEALFALASCLLAQPAMGQDLPGDSDAMSGGLPLQSLQRLVADFDFEEAARVRVDFPLDFQNLGHVHGFPDFGQMQLTTERATSGRWSLGFELDGASLAAGVPPGIIPVIPLADYVVAVDVCTSDLAHARARVIAAFHDSAGNRIAESLVESRPVRTRGRWERLSVHARGDFPDATDLVIELQLLQPEHYADGSEERRHPVLHDVRGQAWFDSLTVHHLPQIMLSTGSPLNVMKLPKAPELQVRVRDLTPDVLTAKLTIEDLEGDTVHRDVFKATRGRRPVVIELPIDRAGWYRAVVELIGGGGRVAGTRELHFVVLPPDRRSVVHDPDRHLSVLLPLDSERRVEHLPKLLSDLNVGGVVAEIWDERLTLAELPQLYENLRGLFEKLLTMHIDVTFALNAVPHDLAEQLGLDASQILELFGRAPETWRPHLDEMLINYGLRLNRWQIGGIAEADAFWKEDLEALVGQAERHLGSVIPEPSIIIPVRAEHDVSGLPSVHSLHASVPHEIQPDMIPSYAAAWTARDEDLLVTFETLPPERFTPRQHVIDLLLRGLWGWRNGLSRMAIDAPWDNEGDDRGSVSPHPAFAAWSGLADQLRGRRFAGELPMPEGVHAWLMEDEDGDEGAIVIWCDHCTARNPLPLNMVLGKGRVQTIDAFGNRHDVPLERSGHALSITDMPLFIENIDLKLAQFRASFRFDPPYVEARHRMQDYQIVLRNPWPMSISGRLRLTTPTGCNFTPRRHEFMIQAGEEIRLPLSAVVERGVTAGVKRIEAEVDLSSEGEHRLRLQTEVEVGWRELEIGAQWRIARNAETGTTDLIIVQRVTNQGERTMNLDAFVRTPGLRQHRRIIAALEPGMTATKTFHIPEGASLLAGRDVRVVVAEHDGTAQLSRILHIPAVVGMSE